ncbi:MAG: YcjF family protein [Bacteroidales bacterium]|nr:YcjF family protein [Bacteroidales bacterium]
MKKNIILIVGVTLALVAILVLGSIVSIGDKIGEFAGPVGELVFYGVIAVLLAIFIIVPLVKVWAAPEMPALTTDDAQDPEALAKLGHKLSANCGYLSDGKAREDHKAGLAQSLKAADGNADALRGLINDEIDLRIKGSNELGVVGIDKRIREWSRTVFMVTAISQNSKFDSLSVIALNYKMIEDIILSSGFRPTRPQMFRIYARVLGTSLISMVASDAIDELGSDLAGGSAAGDIAVSGNGKFLDSLHRLKIPEIVLGSAVDGALNALLTLRIGYVTKAYILKGTKSLQDNQIRKEVKRKAIKDAYATLPAIISSSATVLGKGLAGKLVSFFTHHSSNEEVMA